ELQIERRRQVLALFLGRSLYVRELGPKGGIEIVWPKGTGMDRTRNELPEGIEVLKCRLIRVVVVRRRIVDISREPNGIADFLALDESEDFGDLEFSAQRRTIVGLCDCLTAKFSVDVVNHVEADRHIGSDNLPGGRRRFELPLQPRQLRGPEKIGLGPIRR